ncbi:MAG: gliding motility-like protein [Cytophagaceae bacterium]|jgi:hypothetical protein|nr:gliding motility-like protein [Cytophagaceae bacterium]
MKNIALFIFLLTALFAQAQKPTPTLEIVPQQESWMAGTDFEARAVLVNGPMKEAEFFFSKTPIPKDMDGAGRIKFRVSPGAYDAAGQVRKEFEITVRYKQKGKIITLTTKHIYVVKRPNLIYKGPVGSLLYTYCGNELFVTCPDLGAQYNPSFQASGSLLIKGSQKGQLIAVPTYQEVILHVSSGGAAIDTKKFKAVAPPLPTLHLLLDSMPCKPMQAVSSKSKLYLSIEPDADFFANYPKDARYNLAQGFLKVTRNGITVGSAEFTDQTIDLSTLGITFQKKDVLNFEIAGVNRQNFLNQQIAEKGLTQTFLLTIQ